MPVLATVDRFEEEVAVVRLDDGQELTLPKAELPSGSHEGARLVLGFVTSSEDEAKRAEAARRLLTDLLRRKD